MNAHIPTLEILLGISDDDSLVRLNATLHLTDLRCPLSSEPCLAGLDLGVSRTITLQGWVAVEGRPRSPPSVRGRDIS